MDFLWTYVAAWDKPIFIHVPLHLTVSGSECFLSWTRPQLFGALMMIMYKGMDKKGKHTYLGVALILLKRHFILQGDWHDKRKKNKIPIIKY